MKLNKTEMKSPLKYDSKPKSKSVKKNPIEKWLKKQFREGFSKMKSSFEELDIQKTGQVITNSRLLFGFFLYYE